MISFLKCQNIESYIFEVVSNRDMLNHIRDIGFPLYGGLALAYDVYSLDSIDDLINNSCVIKELPVSDSIPPSRIDLTGHTTGNSFTIVWFRDQKSLRHFINGRKRITINEVGNMRSEHYYIPFRDFVKDSKIRYKKNIILHETVLKL